MLDDPKKINTVEKSSMDWETYKLKHGIEDDVEQGAKDGYEGVLTFCGWEQAS